MARLLVTFVMNVYVVLKSGFGLTKFLSHF